MENVRASRQEVKQVGKSLQTRKADRQARASRQAGMSLQAGGQVGRQEPPGRKTGRKARASRLVVWKWQAREILETKDVAEGMS